MQLLHVPILAVLIASLTQSCTQSPSAPEFELPAPMLPGEPAELAPSHARLVTPYSSSLHADVETCAECHPAHAKQWRESVHSLASFNNPFYRVAFEDYVNKVGRDHANFCAGCHDPTLLDGTALKDPIEPNNPLAHAGVTCMSCHGISSATTTGVGSYELTTAPISPPKDDDPESLRVHRERMARPVLKSNALCITCHKGFLSHASGHTMFLPALDEHRPWRESSWGGSNAQRMVREPKQRSCTDCHMPNRDGHHSHRFAGGHTDLARAINSDLQAKAIEEVTHDTIALGIHVNPNTKHPAQPPLIDVVIINHGVGHRFPGGARDLRDTWIEVEFLDATGATVASSGQRYRTDPTESDVHRLRVGLVDETGKLIETHGVGHFRTPAFDHTLAPNDSAIARYQLQGAEIPSVAVRARLLQRRLNPTFHRYACKQASEPNAKRFIEATFDYTGLRVDPCSDQPITTLATAQLSLTPSATSTSEALEPWEQLYWYGIALTGDLQERARNAIVVLERALTLVPSSSKRAETMVRAELARALLRAGKSGEALEELQRAEQILPNEPLIFTLRAKALRQVWKLEESIEPLRKALASAPRDAGLARELALAYGSTQAHTQALEAAQRGLRLEPRDVDLLRLQMLAYQHLAPESPEYAAAKQAFSRHKRDETAPSIRSACSRSSPQCQKEQLPIPLRTLRISASTP